MHKQKHIILAVVLILILGVIDFYLLNFSEFNNDEAGWALYAKDSIACKIMPYRGIEGSIGIYQGLFVAYVYICWFFLFGCSMSSVAALLIAHHLASVLILYLLARRMYNQFIAILSCVFYVVSPAFVAFYSLKGNDYCFYFIPLTVVMYALHKIVNDKNQRYFIVLALFLGIATQCHSSAYFVIPAIIIFLLHNFSMLRGFNKSRYIIFSIIVFLIIAGRHLYTVLADKGRIITYFNPGNNVLSTMHGVLIQIAPVGSFEYMRAPTLEGLAYLALDPNVVLLILFLMCSPFKAIDLKFKRNDYLLSFWLAATLFLFILLCYCFNHNPSPIFAVFFPAVFIAEASVVYKLYSNVKRPILKKGVIYFAILIVSINMCISFFDMQFIRNTGGVGWHRPTRSIKVGVVDYIFSRDSDPNIILVGEPSSVWWSQSPYNFIIQTTHKQIGAAGRLSFYIIEEKSMWYKPEYDKLLENMPIIDEIKIGSVKIVESSQFDENAGVVLRRSG